MAKARKTAAKAGKAKRAKKTKATKAKTKRTVTGKLRPKRRVGIMDKLANASKLVADSIEETAKMRRQMRYPGIDEG